MDEIIKLLKKDIADCRVNDGNCVDNTDDVTYALATLETLIEAINYTQCCEQLLCVNGSGKIITNLNK